MPDPTRPVAGAPIDTDWGQQVHDRVFQPPGIVCHQASGGASSVGTTYEQLGIDTADDDPGGWLASDTITVGTGRGGLYAYSLLVAADGDDNEAARVELRVNGTGHVSPRFDLESAQIQYPISGVVEVSAGDEITVWARASATTSVRVAGFSMVMVGTSIGA